MLGLPDSCGGISLRYTQMMLPVELMQDGQIRQAGRMVHSV
jgi:hypothetical protein